jgi:hypothetical protein
MAEMSHVSYFNLMTYDKLQKIIFLITRSGTLLAIGICVVEIED